MRQQQPIQDYYEGSIGQITLTYLIKGETYYLRIESTDNYTIIAQSTTQIITFTYSGNATNHLTFELYANDDSTLLDTFEMPIIYQTDQLQPGALGDIISTYAVPIILVFFLLVVLTRFKIF